MPDMFGEASSLGKSVEWEKKLSYMSLVGCVLVIAFRNVGIAVDELVGNVLQFRQALRRVWESPVFGGAWVAGRVVFIKFYKPVVVAERSEKRNHSLDEMTKRFALKSPLILRALIKAKLVAHRVKGLSVCSLASLVAKPLECRATGEKSPPNNH